jgi:hypothetical protein
VRYLGPILTGVEVIARGGMTENKRDRIFLTTGEIVSTDGKLLASSTAKYMPIRDLDPNVLFADFQGTPEQIREFLPGRPATEHAHKHQN